MLRQTMDSVAVGSWRRCPRRSLVLLMATLCLSGALRIDPARAIEARSDIVGKAGVFAGEVKLFLDDLGLTREAFSVRFNRCEGQPNSRNDVFYIWIGVRAIAPDEDAAEKLTALRDRWQERQWDVYRYRALKNGGINVAAREPATGNTYSLDSGFMIGSNKYLVGFFNSPCFRNADGDVTFGPVKQLAE